MAATRKEFRKDEIQEFLVRSGKPLEYRTFHALSATGLKTNLSEYFASSDETDREVDVTSFSSDEAIQRVVRWFGECKYAKDRAWILMYSDLRADLMVDWMILPKSKNLEAHSANLLRENGDEFLGLWHFKRDSHYAHSLLSCAANLKDGKDNDPAFNDLRKITDISWTYAENGEKLGATLHPYVVAFPSLVVDGQLFKASFDIGKKEFSIDETKFGRLSWPGCRRGTAVDVVSIDAIDDYAKELKKTIDGLFEILSDLPDPNAKERPSLQELHRRAIDK